MPETLPVDPKYPRRIPDLEMGDLGIRDSGDLGVDFYDRNAKPGEDPGIAFINDMGADALAQWLVDRAMARKQPPVGCREPGQDCEIPDVIRKAVAAVRREAGFGERDFTPVGQTKGLVDRSIETYYDDTEKKNEAYADVPEASNPDHELPMAEGEPHARKKLEVRASPDLGFGEDNKPAAKDPTLFSVASPLVVHRHDDFQPGLRDDPIQTVGRSDHGLRGDYVATDLPGSMKAKMDTGMEDADEWDDGDFSDDLDLNNFDFADPATDSPFR